MADEPEYDPNNAPSDTPVDPGGADEVENIIPPEQAPMDDAAGGPQAEDPNAPVDDTPTAEDDADKLGDFA